MKKQILTATVITLSIIACKDKSKDETTPKPTLSSKQTMMIGKDWKIKNVFSDGKDITAMFPKCVMDNIVYHFNDAGTGYTDEGATKCETEDPQKSNITWVLEKNETRLITTGVDGKDTFEINSVSASELKLETEGSIITLKN